MTAAALCAAAGTAGAASVNPDGTVTSDELVVNGSAEAGLSGWQPSSGWSATGYGQPGERPPAPDPQFYGSRFFDPGAQASATLSQTVDLTSFAAAIDTGRQALSFGVSVLTWENLNDSALLRVTPLDAGGQPSGSAEEAGGPTAADRGNRSAIVVCGGQFSALPVGTRSVRLDVTSTAAGGVVNHAGVDAVTAILGYATTPAIGAPPFAKGCNSNYASAAELAQPVADPSTPGAPLKTPAPSLRITAPLSMNGRFATVRIVSSNAGTVALKLTTASPQFVPLARSTRRVVAGRSTVRIALTRTARSQLKRKRRAVRLLATLKTADGRTTTARKVAPLR